MIIRRGSTKEITMFVPQKGEFVLDTDKLLLYCGDGVTEIDKLQSQEAPAAVLIAAFGYIPELKKSK